MRPARPFRVTATGDVFDAGNAGHALVMVGARLTGGTAAATAVIRETDGSGEILAELAAPANGADEITIPVSFRRKIHATLAGAETPALICYVE